MNDDMVRMALVGDLYLRTPEPLSLFERTGAHLSGADITFGNLEAPLTNRGTPTPGKSAFISEPRMVEALTAGGFDAVGVANNHSMDYGPQGLLQTLEVLDQAKIGHAGGGASVVEAHRPAIVEAEGVKVAFFSYASVFLPTYAADENRPGIAKVTVATAYQPPSRVFEQPATPPTVLTFPNESDVEAVRRDIRNAKKAADIVVLSWHWGVSEGFRRLVPYQIELGHAAIDAGADIIIGHHPHVLQGIEIYQGKVICYSMGNFVFPHRSPTADTDTIILEFQVEGKRIKGASFVPVTPNEKLQPVALQPSQGQGVISKVIQLSGEFGTVFTAKSDEVTIELA